MSDKQHFELVVLGSGPGGYSAAFRAADLGMKVALVERYDTLGGVCLNVGCIPSKALLHVAEVLNEAKEMKAHGVDFGEPKIDIDALRGWKDSVIGKLTMGLKGMAGQRKVTTFTGVGAFTAANEMTVTQDGKAETISFDQSIIAVGSRPVKLPFMPEDDRIIDSTGALELHHAGKRMLVLGGGIIGCEMATVYNALGTEVTIVEMMPQLMPGADKDIVLPCHKMMEKRGMNMRLETKVTEVKAAASGLTVTFEGKHAGSEEFDVILVSVGRIPNGRDVGAEAAGVHVDDRGFITVDRQMRTNLPHIFAIGDVVGQPMLAHKAVPEGRLAAEIASGKTYEFDARCIPSVAYTDPEVAWVGMTEGELKEKGIEYEKGVFPWMASGRSLSLGRSEGMTKLLSCAKTERILGAGIVGRSAGDLISEVGLAIEMGCTVEDIAMTIHPHPTLSETVMQAAEMIEGTITDLIAPKKKSKK